jgi:MYXO-CTERM domain-containing protein
MKLRSMRKFIPSAVLAVGLMGGPAIVHGQTTSTDNPYNGQNTESNLPRDYTQRYGYAGRVPESTGGAGGWGLLGLLGLLGLFGARRTRTTTYETRGTTFEPRTSH